MGIERRMNVNALEGIMRAQAQALNIGDEAKGYKAQVESLMNSAAAPAIRHEVRMYMEAVTSATGPEQDEHLNKLVRALEAYKSSFKDIWTDEKERAPFALALALREKSLQ